MNKSILQKLEKYSLSNIDIKNFFKPKKITIVDYLDLPKYNNIKEILNNPFNSVIIFFPENEQDNQGQWTCVILHNDNKIEYFDPYKNYKPDAEQKWLSSQLKKELKMNKPFLHDLILKSGYNKIIVNNYPFQKLNKNIDTCGDHCCVRILNKNLTLKEYWNKIKKTGLSPDEYVVKIVYNKIHK